MTWYAIFLVKTMTLKKKWPLLTGEDFCYIYQRTNCFDKNDS